MLLKYTHIVLFSFLLAFYSSNSYQKNTTIKIKKNVLIKDYFSYLDSLVTKYDSLTNYKLTEHLLVRSNYWIIDTLANTDYYKMIKRDSFVYDQKKLIALPKGNLLIIPNEKFAKNIAARIASDSFDINIPEFKLRIYQNKKLLYSFPIRVGKNKRRFLKMADRKVSLKTKTGKGKIIDIVRNPDFYNPVNGKQFTHTKRDDKKTTLMPLIPWIEPEINGLKHGQLIHPTTNPKTLNKAYSNGCIGTKEADAWFIYYHASIGTRINIRYDLTVLKENGDTLKLKNIYKNK